VSAGKVITVVYLTTTATSIPLGLFIDKYGNRRALTIIGLLVFLTAQIIFLTWPQCDGEVLSGAVVGLYFEGLGYSFYANVMVASIPLVVRMKLLGTAFGIM
jgi:MFS family permease